ncbi:MAG: hypothetical protein M3Y68_12305, partial [Chloroflexota bacterium]|nr:hypothetical protein [Chloroflexota bacterium]
ATALFIVMRRRLQGIEGNYVARGFAACAIASLAMGISLWLWVEGTGHLAYWVVALGGVLIGGLTYGAGITVLRVPEVQVILSSIRRRLLPAVSR